MQNCNMHVTYDASWKAWGSYGNYHPAVCTGACFSTACITGFTLLFCVTSCFETIKFHFIMANYANEYELKHLHFYSCLICSFCFLFVGPLGSDKISPSLGLLPWNVVWCIVGFICWKGHISWRWLSLSFSGSSDTNLDASVLTAFLHCNIHPWRSINPSCNFIRITPSLFHT